MSSLSTCTTCHKTASSCSLPMLKFCAKCKTTLYCSRTCQTANWKAHKKICAAQNASRAFVAVHAQPSSTYSAARLTNLQTHVPNPFTKLDNGTSLHDRLETDVFKLLLDSFRLREADEANFEHRTRPRSIYSGAASSLGAFRVYVASAGARNLLPPWWSAEAQTACEAVAESELSSRLGEHDVTERYGDEKAPMQLRMLAEAVYGAGLMGQDGTGMRRVMIEMERGTGEKCVSMLSVGGM
jgi:splicing suppressor protein 51